jgi:hypothetical protein
MTIDYNVDFVVKYHDIKEDLLEKKKSEQEEYTEDEMTLIIDELYRHELLSVLNCDDICDEKLSETMNQLYNEMKVYPPFTEIMGLFKQQRFAQEGVDEDIVFTCLFCYDTFFILHKCICEFFNKREISSDLLEEFRSCIKTL